MTYIIRSGDTLFNIARRFHTTVNSIIALNPQITNPDEILPGQLLNIPDPAFYCPRLSQGNRGPGVRRLQLLLTFARRDPGRVDGIFGPKTLSALKAFQSSQKELEVTGIADLETWTALGAECQPRSRITTHMIRPGDTLFILAIRFNVTIESILLINPLITDTTYLRVGQIINIPPTM